MTAKEFTLTLHFVSCRLPSLLYPIFTEHLHPEMQALYRKKKIVKEKEVVGIMFNVKKPVEIGRKLKEMALYQVKVSYLRKNLYLYLPTGEARHFRLKKGDVKIKCELKGNWFKLYYPRAKRLCTIESFFTKA